MTYVLFKQKMFAIVDKLVKESKHTRKAICFDTMRNSGFSDKLINKYIDELIEMKIAKEEKGIIKWCIENGQTT